MAAWISAIFAGLALAGSLLVFIAAMGRRDGAQSADVTQWRVTVDRTIEKLERYHGEHFAHAASRLMHPDPDVTKASVELLRQSQITLNEKIGEHIDQDERMWTKLDTTIDKFREEYQRNNEIMVELVAKLISKLGD